MADVHQTTAREKPGQTGLNHSPATGQVSADSKRMDTALSRIAEKEIIFRHEKKGFRISSKTLLAENTRFELVRLLHQHAFQACAIDH